MAKLFFPFVLGHFEVSTLILDYVIVKNFKMAKHEREKICEPFWSLNAHPVTWAISDTAVLGHFEV